MFCATSRPSASHRRIGPSGVRTGVAGRPMKPPKRATRVDSQTKSGQPLFEQGRPGRKEGALLAPVVKIAGSTGECGPARSKGSAERAHVRAGESQVGGSGGGCSHGSGGPRPGSAYATPGLGRVDARPGGVVSECSPHRLLSTPLALHTACSPHRLLSTPLALHTAATIAPWAARRSPGAGCNRSRYVARRPACHKHRGPVACARVGRCATIARTCVHS